MPFRLVSKMVAKVCRALNETVQAIDLEIALANLGG